MLIVLQAIFFHSISGAQETHKTFLLISFSSFFSPFQGDEGPVGPPGSPGSEVGFTGLEWPV